MQTLKFDYTAPSAASGSAADADGHFELSCLFTGDNVHLTPVGYGRLAVCIANGINEAVKRSLEKECEVTCEIRTHYWRGFSSRNGSSKPKHSQQMLKMRGRGGRGGPGREFGGRGGRGSGGSGARGRGGGTFHPHHPYGRKKEIIISFNFLAVYSNREFQYINMYVPQVCAGRCIRLLMIDGFLNYNHSFILFLVKDRSLKLSAYDWWNC